MSIGTRIRSAVDRLPPLPRFLYKDPVEAGRAEAAGRGETPDALLKRLSWTVLRPIARNLGGDERSLVRGSGMELSEVREYQPGDDVRHIDWNITARSDRPYVREAEAERSLDVWLLLDVSASVEWGTAECLKRDRATEFVAAAGQLLGGHGNRIGALLFAERNVALVPPSGGRMHLLRMLGRLRDMPRQEATGATDLAGALRHAQQVIRGRAVVIVVSDFLVADGWQPELGRLAARHEVVAVRLSDPREGELPDVGVVTFEDPETGDQLRVDTRDRAMRERFRAAARAQDERISGELARAGADELALGTGDPLLPGLLRFLHARKAQKALRARGAQGVRTRAVTDTAAAADRVA